MTYYGCLLMCMKCKFRWLEKRQSESAIRKNINSGRKICPNCRSGSIDKKGNPIIGVSRIWDSKELIQLTARDGLKFY